MVIIRENMGLEIMVKEEIALGDIMTKTKMVITTVDMETTTIIVSQHGLILGMVLQTTNQTIQPLLMGIIIVINNHQTKVILLIHMVVNRIHQIIIIKALRTVINNHNLIAVIQDTAIL